MLGKLYPLGYSALGSWERLQELMADETMLLVDTRYTPYAYNRPKWSRLGPQGLAKTWGSRYYFFTAMNDDLNWLGNKNYKNGGPIELVNAQLGTKCIIDLLSNEWNVILLCGCKRYSECHRRYIAELVQQVMPEVRVVLP